MKTWQVTMAAVILGAWVVSAETSAPPARVEGGAATNAASGLEIQHQLMQGYDLLRASKWTAAATLFEGVLRQDPGSDEATMGLSTVYTQVGKYKEALPLLEGLLKKVPDSPVVKNNLAWVYAKAKDPTVHDPAKAVKYAVDAVLALPSDYNVWNTLAEAYLAAGKYDQALKRAKIAWQLSQAAGMTNDVPFRELIERCQTAAGGKDEKNAGGEGKP